MSDRPNHLIIVTHPGQDGIDIFSAHHDRSDAEVMFDRLEALLPAGASVSLIEVPETDGVVKGSKPVRKVECVPAASSAPSQQTAQPAPPPSAQKQPYRLRTEEELEIATMRALSSGGSQIISSAVLDDDEPIS